MYFLNIYPKCLPILRDYSHCTPLISQNNKLAGLRVFTQKIFYATKVPKSFKIFGTKPTFLLLNGTLSINFIRFKRSSITFEFFQQLPSLSRDLFLYWVFCFFLHLFMNPVYNFQNKLPSDGMFNFHRIFQSCWIILKVIIFFTFNQGFPITDFKCRALYKTFFGLLQLWRGINDCFKEYNPVFT